MNPDARAAASAVRWSRIAIPAGIALVLLSAFRWLLADLLTPYGWSMLAAGAWAGVLFSVLGVLASKRVEGEPRPVGPVLFALGMALLAVYGPWMELDTQARWRLLRAPRERAIQWLHTSQPVADDRGIVKLPQELHGASATGGEVRLGAATTQPTPGPVDTSGARILAGHWPIPGSLDSTAVLFFNYRGVPDGYSGFLRVPGDMPPVYFGRDSLLLVRRMEPGWFLIAAR